MTGITSSIANLLQSIWDVFASLVNTLLSGVQGVFALVATAVHSVVDLMSGLVGFLLGNIVIIGVLVAAFVGYSAYQQKSGRTVGGSSKKIA